MTIPSGSWRELVRFDEPHLAHTVAMSIAAMEFPVRSISTRTGACVDWPGQDEAADGQEEGERPAQPPQHAEAGVTHASAELAAAGPIAIEVHPDDWDDLAEILPELIAEQTEFDEHCMRRDRLVGRAQRIFLIVLTVVLATLAAIGAIRL